MVSSTHSSLLNWIISSMRMGNKADWGKPWKHLGNEDLWKWTTVQHSLKKGLPIVSLSSYKILFQTSYCTKSTKIATPSFSASFLHLLWLCPAAVQSTRLFLLLKQTLYRHPQWHRAERLTLASAQPSVSRTSSCTQTHSGLHLHFCFSPTVSELAMHLISEAALIIIATWLFYKVRPHSENQYKLSFTEPVQSGLLWNVNSPSERSLVTDSFFFQSEHSGNPDWIQSHC